MMKESVWCLDAIYWWDLAFHNLSIGGLADSWDECRSRVQIPQSVWAISHSGRSRNNLWADEICLYSLVTEYLSFLRVNTTVWNKMDSFDILQLPQTAQFLIRIFFFVSEKMKKNEPTRILPRNHFWCCDVTRCQRAAGVRASDLCPPLMASLKIIF